MLLFGELLISHSVGPACSQGSQAVGGDVALICHLRLHGNESQLEAEPALRLLEEGSPEAIRLGRAHPEGWWKTPEHPKVARSAHWAATRAAEWEILVLPAAQGSQRQLCLEALSKPLLLRNLAGPPSGLWLLIPVRAARPPRTRSCLCRGASELRSPRLAAVA